MKANNGFLFGFGNYALVKINALPFVKSCLYTY